MKMAKKKKKKKRKMIEWVVGCCHLRRFRLFFSFKGSPNFWCCGSNLFLNNFSGNPIL